MRYICLAALLATAVAFIPQTPVFSKSGVLASQRSLCILASSEDAGAEAPEAAEAPASKSFKGFGEKPKKVVKQKTKAQLEREKFASAYDDLKSQGVPEYAVYIKEKDASEKEWKFVGSMAVPRNTKVEVAIYENESNLVKGAYKMYPRLREKEAGGFDYGYNLKKFPDEPVKPAVKPTGDKNPVKQFLENMLNPLDASGVQS